MAINIFGYSFVWKNYIRNAQMEKYIKYRYYQILAPLDRGLATGGGSPCGRTPARPPLPCLGTSRPRDIGWRSPPTCHWKIGTLDT